MVISRRLFSKTIPAALLLGFGTTGSALAGDTLSYVGSSTVGKYMERAAKVYTAASFKLNTKPESGGGENATAAGKTDLGGVARDVKPAILAKGVHKVLIGKDAIGVWVHPSNAVSDLSSAQLKGIFTGKITNWKEVGGADKAISVYIVNKQSATRKVFAKVVLQDEKYAGANITTVRPDPAILEKVAKDEGAIGQLSFAFAQAGAPVKRVAVDGQAPTVENANYPITRPLNLITKGEPQGAVKAFIDWTLSADGQKVVKELFVGIN